MRNISRNASADPRVQLVPAPRRAHVWLGTLLLIPLAMIAGVHVVTMQHGTPRWIMLLPACLVLLLWLGLDRLMRRHRLSLAGEVLDVRTSFYRRQVPLAALDLAHARVMRLSERTEFKPMLKLNGYALPGFHSGHFLLRDRQHAFVATAGGDRVLWLPVIGQAGLLLQAEDPAALLDALQGMANSAARR